MATTVSIGTESSTTVIAVINQSQELCGDEPSYWLWQSEGREGAVYFECDDQSNGAFDDFRELLVSIEGLRATRKTGEQIHFEFRQLDRLDYHELCNALLEMYGRKPNILNILE